VGWHGAGISGVHAFPELRPAFQGPGQLAAASGAV